MSEELKPCPFCGGEARIASNRDWHKIYANHDDECVFDADDADLMYPAQPGYLVEIAEVWNRRAASGAASVEVDRYVRSLAMSLWRAHYIALAPEFELCDDTCGVLSQIDNMLTGLTLATPPAAAIKSGDLIAVPRATLEAIDAAMSHMGDALNEIDAVEDGDEEATEFAFDAIRALLATPPAAASQPKDAP